MATRLQRKAFRKNARHSTGPQTPEGKARSSQNARKHGLFARDTLLPGEDPEEFLQLITDLEQELQASSGFERRLVRHIADTEWRMRRLVRLETGALTSQLEKERLHAQRVQAQLGQLNQALQAKLGGQNQSVPAKPGGDNQSVQTEHHEESAPPAGPYQQSTKELGAVVAGDRDTPVLLTLSLYEARLTRKYFGLLKQLRLTQKLRRAAEAMEPRPLPAETETRPPAAESPPPPPPPTPAASHNTVHLEPSSPEYLSREAAQDRSPWVERSGTLGAKPLEGEAPQGAQEQTGPFVSAEIDVRRASIIPKQDQRHAPKTVHGSAK